MQIVTCVSWVTRVTWVAWLHGPTVRSTHVTHATHVTLQPGHSNSRLVLAKTLDVGRGAVAEPAVKLSLVLELLAAQPWYHDEARIRLGQRGHVHPELLELGDGEDVFLAVAPTLLHFLQRDVSGHLRGEMPNGGSDLWLVGQVGASEGEGGEQFVEVDPAGVRVVVAQGELGFFARHGKPLDETDPAVDARTAAAPVFEPKSNDFESE